MVCSAGYKTCIKIIFCIILTIMERKPDSVKRPGILRKTLRSIGQLFGRKRAFFAEQEKHARTEDREKIIKTDHGARRKVTRKRKKRLENRARAVQARVNKTWK